MSGQAGPCHRIKTISLSRGIDNGCAIHRVDNSQTVADTDQNHITLFFSSPQLCGSRPVAPRHPLVKLRQPDTGPNSRSHTNPCEAAAAPRGAFTDGKRINRFR